MNSSKIMENILNSIITGIISFSLPIILPFIYSLIMEWMYDIPIWKGLFNISVHVYIVLFIPFGFWIIRKYIKTKMNEGVLWSGIIRNKKYEDIDQFEYNELLWTIQINSYSLNHAQVYGNIDDYGTFQEIINNLGIKHNPRCSKCGAELYYTRHDLWYTYDCVNPDCSFVKRTLQSRDKMKDISLKQYKYKLELEFKENNKS